MTNHPLPELRTALDRARPALEDFANAAGIPTETLHAYHNGHRRAPVDVCRRVVQSLRAQSAELDALATELEQAIETTTVAVA